MLTSERRPNGPFRMWPLPRGSGGTTVGRHSLWFLGKVWHHSSIAHPEVRMFRGVIVLAIATAPLLLLAGEAPYRPKIPKVWVESELDQLDVPVSVPAYSQKIISPDYYYRIPVATIYKSYPVYAPGRAPAGYLEKLERLGPQLAFDPVRLKT